MAFTVEKIIVGMARVYLNGTAIGYTSEDGVTAEVSAQDLTKVKAAESLGTLKNYRSNIERQIKFAMLEFDLETMITLMGLDANVTVDSSGGVDSIQIKYSVELPSFNLMFVVDNGPNGKVVTYSTTGQPVEQGALKFSKTEVTMLEVTVEETIDPTTNGFGTLSMEDASETAFTIATFTPADNATGVSGTANIEIEFSTGVSNHSVNTGNFLLFLKTTVTPVTCTVAYKSDGAGGFLNDTIVINPGSTLTAGAVYAVVVSPNVMSTTGKRLTGTNTSDFTIAP